MPSTDPDLHSLYSRLEEVLGTEHADTLMTHLPSHPALELANKSDIAMLAARFDRLEDRFDHLQDSLRDQLKVYSVTTVGAMTALTAIYAALLAAIA